MKIKVFCIELLMLTSLSCTTKKNRQIYEIVQESLACQAFDKPRTVLFIADNMCKECISHEFLNIRQLDKKGDEIVIVGLFDNKRYFSATVSKLPNLSVYISPAQYKLPDNMPRQPFYCLFHNDTKSISNIFYPEPCDTSKTFDYFKSIPITGK